MLGEDAQAVASIPHQATDPPPPQADTPAPLVPATEPDYQVPVETYSVTVVSDEHQPELFGEDNGNLIHVKFVSSQELNKALEENKKLVREAAHNQHKILQLENSVSTGIECFFIY